MNQSTGQTARSCGDVNRLSRRDAMGLLVAAAGTAAAMPSTGIAESAAKRTPGRPDDALTTPKDATVATTSGRVRGFKRQGVFTFLGIPYGADTSGSARFLPPKPPTSWNDDRWTILYGPVSPQAVADVREVQRVFVEDAVHGQPGEDCLRVNVWSPALNRDAKLPVIFWIHGGGFTAGSSQEHPAYDGTNTARNGSVFVSVNHRLNAFGFLDLSTLGGSYASAPNVGMLDLVLALEWVRDNIAAFGGDPSRVTIVGQSGGGGKVSTLMAMPSAKGLFHRAVVMSGSLPPASRGTASRDIAAAVIKELGLRDGDVEALQHVEAARLVAAGAAVGTRVGGFGGGFAPVVDGRVLPEAWATAAPQQSANVPLIVGSVRDEFRPVGWSVSEQELPSRLPPPLQPKATEIVAAARRTYPEMPPTELASMLGGMFFRNLALEQVRKQQALGGAPVYSYWFTWPTPLLDGAIGCPHGIDIAFLFDNTVLCDKLTGGTAEAQRIAAQMNTALIAFATTGKPTRPELPWLPYDPQEVPTMVFDARSAMVDDPAGEIRRLMEPKFG